MADVTTGASITFSSGFFAEITNIGHSGINRGSVDVTHMGTTDAREFMPTDLYDAGELSVELQFDPDSSPPIDQAAETVTVTFPTPSGGVSGATWAADGFMTDFEYTGPLEDKMTATATIKFTGTITYTASA